MEQLLVVEDDKALNIGLCKALESEQYHVVSCHTIQEAREQLWCGPIALVLLDIQLPDGNGLVFLRELKKDKLERPVILLTVNDTDKDIVEGLDCGADDYVTKPFSLSVLRARIQSQLRRRQQISEDGVVEIEPFVFDFIHYTFYVRGKEVILSKTEQKLLKILVRNQGCIMSREVLIEHIWSEEQFVDANALSVTIKRLRDKLGAHHYIKTVYGVGYRWEKNNG